MQADETLCFKSGKDYVKAEWGYDDYAESPRTDRDNLGKMVFIKNRNGRFGDEQIDNWREFFIDQITDIANGNPPVNHYEGEVKFRIPSAEEARENPKLEKYVTSAGRFDKELFSQDMDAALDRAESGLKGFRAIITGGITLDDDQLALSDEYRIDFDTEEFPEHGTYYWMLGKIADAIDSVLKEDFGITRESYSMNWRLENSLDDLTESELYDKWAESKAAVIPIDLYIHSGETCREAPVRKTTSAENNRDGGYIDNDGFAYVDKDNEEYRQELESGKTEEEAKKWAEQNLRGEIQDYASYLEGDIHTLTVSYFNPKTNEWEKSDMEAEILGGTLEQALKDRGTSIDEVLDKNTVFSLENSVNPEFKSETARMYIEDIRKNLPDFDNSLKAAATSVSKQWKAKAETNREETDRLNRWELRKKALKEYFKENGIDSAEKTFAFLAKETGFKEKSQSLPPLSLQDKSLVAYFAKINNPARSDNGGLAKLLLVDEKNKSLAYFDSPSYIITKGDIWGKTVNLGSGKKVEEKAKELLRYGFKDVDLSSKFLAKNQKHFTRLEIERESGRER